MRRSAFVWPLRLLLGAFFISALSAAAGEDTRVALVIGNNKYPSAALKNPVNDATAMAKKLQEMGFEVILRTDSNQRQMTRAITEFGEKLTRGSVGVFYYAGHGLQARGRNYLVPVDAEVTSEFAVGSETIDVERVLEQLSRARLSMVILDACRNNPFERRFRSGAGSGLAQIDAPAGTLIAYATSPGKVALDGGGTHGTYTEALLKAMDVPGQRVEDVFKQVRIDVMKMTGNQQIPWESSSLTGDFAFRPSAAVAEQAPRNRDADAAAVALREQMAALQADIAKLREQRPAVTAVPSANDQEFQQAQKEAAALREQLAIMNAEIAKLRENRPAAANTAKQTDDERKSLESEATLRTQIASLNAEIASIRLATGPKEATPEEKAAWQKQFEKLDALQGKPTLASALIALLNISAETDVARIRAFERQVLSRDYSSGIAFGVDNNGLLSWGGSYRQMNPHNARQVAVDFCQRGGAKCLPVLINGDFDAKALRQAVRGLALQPLEAVRTGVVNSFAGAITEAAVGIGPRGAGFSYNPMGYTYARAATR